jgi:hypothetical protein
MPESAKVVAVLGRAPTQRSEDLVFKTRGVVVPSDPLRTARHEAGDAGRVDVTSQNRKVPEHCGFHVQILDRRPIELLKGLQK